MSNIIKILGTAFFTILYSYSAQAATLPEYAVNTVQNHELSRSEQKCIDEGYKITYANCANQTAPSERCPHNDSYYRICSQEQWCRNNNYRFSATDCKAPFYPFKMCANKFPLYRICQENIEKSCIAEGYAHKSKCQLTDKKCPYSVDYGICCDECPNFSHKLDSIPAGYIAVGEACTTCKGITKTNIAPAPCEGFKECEFGPLSEITPSCQQASTILYSACKTSADVCRDKGYTYTSCSESEDIVDCPENKNFKLCVVNCLKQARLKHPTSDVFDKDTTDPVVDITKTELISLVGDPYPTCQTQTRPELTLHINHKNLAMYENLLDRKIENTNLNLIFEDPITLSFNGSLHNVKIKAEGNLPDCPLRGTETVISGIVSINGIPALCSNFKITEESKLLSSGSIHGNIEMSRDSALGLKGDLLGNLKARSYTEIFIKGKLKQSVDSTGEAGANDIIFGCNSKVKINEGITADRISIYLKQWTSLDTPSITMISHSDNPNVPNTVAALHMYKYAKIFNAYGDTVFPFAENNGNECANLYYPHIGSATEKEKQTFVYEASNLIADNSWQCQTLDYKQQECD